MSDKLTDKTLNEFLDALASSAPAPGGGSVSALSGALGAALVLVLLWICAKTEIQSSSTAEQQHSRWFIRWLPGVARYSRTLSQLPSIS